MDSKRITLNPQFIAAISVLLIALNVVMGIVLTNRSKTTMKTLIDKRMLDVSNTAAAMLNGDNIKTITADSKDTEEYKKDFDILKNFQDNIELAFIYVVRPAGDGRFIFIIDPAEEEAAEYGEEIYFTEALGKAAAGFPAVETTPYADRFGRFYSSYSPIFDSAGNVVAIVGVDFNADWYDKQISKDTSTILTGIILSLFMAAMIIINLIGRRWRFKVVTAELVRLADYLDNITQEITGSSKIKNLAASPNSSSDDLSELGEKIRLMRKEIHQYINNLNTKANRMIKILDSNYSSVYYVNLDKDECICYQKSYRENDHINEGDSRSYKEAFYCYAHKYVMEEYREDFLNFVEAENVREAFKKRNVIAYRYLAVKNNREVFEMLKMTRIPYDEDINTRANELSVGIINIDAETRDDIAKRQALNDALKVAEQASKAKTAFLSNMSHEIRTPMNVIIGLGTLALHEQNLSDTMRDYLRKIETAAQHLLGLINDILDMSRIESGRMVVKNEEFSFPKLIEQINTIFSAQCQEKNLEYNCRINGELDEYYIGDSIKLRQVLINILGNAVKFTNEGGSVNLIVEKTAEFDGQSTLKFIVKDTGVGMSKEYLPKIFEAFSQEDSSVKNKYGSTGLGMAITKSIIEMLNGKIEVDSEKGVGTTFTIVVTLRNSEKVVSNDDANIRLQDLSVLVIDDDKTACEHAKLVLEQAGVAVDTVLSGKEALKMIKLRHARRNPYNLIVVDWQMPELNGMEVTRQIRSLIGNESAIIILTAYNWEDIADEAKAAGVDSFIAKPMFSSSLIDEFKNALNKRNDSSVEVKRKADLKGRKILLAEDVPVNAEIMIMVLKMREIEAEHAENGRIAVEMFQKSPPNYYDAILMDMRMSEMNGLEATQAIRALDREDAKTIPIIALTANAFDEDVQRSLQAGLNAHLSKPVEPEKLFETLENMIKP